MTIFDRFKTKFENKTVLITGGAGFIGSNMARALHELGAKVRIVDNLLTGHRKNIADLIDDGLDFIEADIRDYQTCLDALSGVDYVTHQAALGSVPRSIENPLLCHDHNVNGTLNIMRAAVEKRINRLVFASSSSIYGDEKTLPKIEHRTGRLLSPYAATKCIGEIYGGVMNATYGLDVVGLRYFNIYGPRQDPEGQYAAVIPKFIAMLVAGESPTIFGDGEQSRDFTFIDNAILANLIAMTREENFGFEIFNIACGEQLTINELFDFLKKAIIQHHPKVSEINVIHGKPRRGDILHSYANIDKAVEQLGYDVVVEVAEGIQKTVNWFVSH